MSLYADYLKERSGKGMVEFSFGFATYSTLPDGLYIEDIYVHPDYRKAGIASELADEVTRRAIEGKFNFIYGSVSPLANNSTDSLKVLLAYGFKLHSASQDFIFLRKEI